MILQTFKTFVLQKAPLRSDKPSHRVGETTFANHMPHKDLYPECIKNVAQLSKKTNNPSKQWADNLKTFHQRRCTNGQDAHHHQGATD